MKAKFEHLAARQKNRSFLCYEVSPRTFSFKWHYHPEYELTLIIRGEGKRLVGNSYEHFGPNDLVLLGPLVPHTWVSEKLEKENTVAIVVQFSSEFISPILAYREMDSIKKMLEKSYTGLQIENHKNEASELMYKMLRSNDFEQTILLLQLLHLLSRSKLKRLSSEKFLALKGNENEQRINKVFQYVQKEYTSSISLKKAASLVFLSESAFCKFFKRVSGRTFSDYVNETRIAHANRILIETDKPISQVAFESGFSSITYFNRVFLRKKHSRPRDIRKTTHMSLKKMMES